MTNPTVCRNAYQLSPIPTAIRRPRYLLRKQDSSPLRLSSRAATQTRPDCNPQVRIVQLSEVGNVPKQTS
ncbi:hypothetical protein NJB1604_48980 [Mycobacterium marinum]|nr:hypothetical protein NJB1604_48980 [Mycobacterium marinum]